MPSIRVLATPAVIAAALALGACGSSDNNKSSSSTPSTQASTTANTTASTTATTGSTSGGKYSADDIQKEAQALSTKWTAKSQELATSLASDPKSAKQKLGPFIDEFKKDYNALLDKVKNSDAPASVKTAIEQQQQTLSKAFDTLKSQLAQLP